MAIKSIAAGLNTSLSRCPRDAAIVAVNSMVKHELGASAYRERCGMRRAVEAIYSEHPQMKSLRDVPTTAELGPLTGVPAEAARHVTTENSAWRRS